MTRLGADTDALRDLGSTLRRCASELDRIAIGLDGRVRGAGWRGPDAVRFERDWTGVQRLRLASGAQRCAELASIVDRQAGEQERVSATSGGAHPGLGTGAGVSLGGRAPDGNAPTGSTSGPSRAAPPVPAAPVAERRYLGGVDLTVAFGTLAIAGDLSVQALHDGRVRVVLGESTGVGVAAGAGGSVDVAVGDETPDPVAAAGLSAAVTGRLGGVERRSWTVHPDEIDDLLVRLGAETVVDATPFTPALEAAAGLVDRATEWLTGLDPGVDQLATPPAPDATERLVELTVLASAGAGAGRSDGPGSVAGLAAAGSGSVRAGIRTEGSGDGARSSAVIEANGTASAALGGALLGRLGVALGDSVDAAGSLRVELPMTGPDRGTHVVVTHNGGNGSTLTETRAVVDLTHPGLADGALRVGAAADAIRDGDVDRAVELLGSMRWPDEAVTSVVGTAEVSGSSARAGGRVAFGPGVGVAARGTPSRSRAESPPVDGRSVSSADGAWRPRASGSATTPAPPRRSS